MVREDVRLLYLVVRTLDDLVDRADADAGARLRLVEQWASGARTVGREASILEQLARRYPGLPADAILDFCQGQRQDLHGPAVFNTERELDLYCYRVAGTVGTLMAWMLGARHPNARLAAQSLGIAMQRTNILRDIDEDLAQGRTYIPLETLRLTGITDLSVADRSLLLRVETAIADWWYEQGMSGLPHLKTGRRAVRIAARNYRQILRQIAQDGWGIKRPWRSRVSRPRQLLLAVSSLVR